jgi:hypothetical protein
MSHANDLPPPMNDEIERLHDVFADYDRPTQMIGDMAAPYPADHPFHTKPLRSLTVEDFTCFGDYFWNAMLTEGTFDDYAYLLPRLLELIVVETSHNNEKSMSRFDPEVVFAKLVYDPRHASDVGFSHWPSAQADAIRGYLNVLWDWLLDRPFTWYGDENLPVLRTCTKSLFTPVSVGEA